MDPTPFIPSRDEIRTSLEGASAADVVLLVHQHLRVGSIAGATLACEVAREMGLADTGLTLAHAMARFAAGERERGLALVGEVLAASPEHLLGLFTRAHMHLALGDGDSGRALLEQIVERCPDFPGAQAAIATLVFPGPHYREVLAGMHRLLRPATYLEIGVETGATLALATAATVALGIDPAPLEPLVPLPPAARVVRATSDAFFAGNTREKALAGRTVDLAFIDGMHWFEFALRDFANVERWAAPGSTIVLHDCLPPTRAAGRRERASTFWVGDVWKVLECLLDHRPDLRISIVPAPPSGLVVVRRLDPGSTVLFDRMDPLVREYRDREYPHMPGCWPDRYRVTPNSPAGIREALSA